MSDSLRNELKPTRLFGIGVIVIFLGGGILWSTLAPLSGAVIANGVVGFESRHKTIQHLEGGIIKKILVKEGDRIKQGQLIVILDDTTARARSEELRNRIRTLAAEEARLHAERSGKHEVEFRHELLQPAHDPEVSVVLKQQKSHFTARAKNLESQRSILRKRVDQLEKQIEGMEIQLKGVRTQLRLIREEASGVRELYQKGYERKTRVLELMRAEAQLVAREGELIASIARGEEAIGETQIRVNNLTTDLLEKVDARLTQVQAERVSTEKLYRDWTDRLARTRITSPIEGVVLDVKFKTVGGVVQPSEPIMDIVPSLDDLIVNARIRPTDIDEVAAGSSATVLFTAYKQRYQDHVNARVIRVSADSFKDEDTGESYFLADIEIDAEHLGKVAPEFMLTAGMPAEIFITTVERTAFDYLIQPIRNSFDRAFREK